jgi:membrane associated rhomboid family serine protease
VIFTPARVASLLAAASALAAGLAPAVANFDTTSTLGALGGVAGVVGVLVTFLKGQRAHEARTWAPTTWQPPDVDVPQNEPHL